MGARLPQPALPGTAQRGAPHGRANNPFSGQERGRSSTIRHRHLTRFGHPRSPPVRTPGTRLKGSTAERRRSQLSDNPPPPPAAHLPGERGQTRPPPPPHPPQPPAVPNAAAPAAPRPAPAAAASAGRPLPAPRPHRSAPAGTRRRGGNPEERPAPPPPAPLSRSWPKSVFHASRERSSAPRSLRGAARAELLG